MAGFPGRLRENLISCQNLIVIQLQREPAIAFHLPWYANQNQVFSVDKVGKS